MKSQHFHNKLLPKVFTRMVFIHFLRHVTLSITGIVDCMVVGTHYGETGLSAMQLAMPLFFVYEVISQILGSGLVLILTRLLFNGEEDEGFKVFSTVCRITVLIALGFTAVGLFIPSFAVKIFAGSLDDPMAIRSIAGYLTPILISAPIILMYNILIAIITMEGTKKLIVWASSLMIIVDVCGDFMAVFLNMGILGIAWASACAYGTAFLLLLIYILRHHSIVQYVSSGCHRKRLAEVIVAGLPSGIMSMCLLLRPYATNHMMLMYGTMDALAALAIQDALHYIPNAFSNGIANTCLLLTGVLQAEEDEEGLKDIRRQIIRWSFLYACFFSVILGILAPFMVSLFTNVPTLRELGTLAFLWYLVSVPFAAFNHAVISYFWGKGERVKANRQIIHGDLVFPILTTYVMAAFFHSAGIFAAFAMSEIIMTCCLLLLAYIKRPMSLESVLAYKELQMAFQTFESVTTGSSRVFDFCLANGISDRYAYAVSLCLEELAVNSLKHGFKDGKVHHLEARVLIQKDYLILRLRDDGRPFDLRTRCQMVHNESPERYIGLRMVYAAADEISYSSALHLNNVCIRLRLFESNEKRQR